LDVIDWNEEKQVPGRHRNEEGNMKTGTMMKRFMKAGSCVAALVVYAVFFCGGVGNAVAANGTPYYSGANFRRS